MYRLIKMTIFGVCICGFASHLLRADTFEDRKKEQMIQDLGIIKHYFEIGYAPSEWKKEYANWDLYESFEIAKEQILTTHKITTKQFQLIVRDFMKSMKDYHVDAMFYSTESASLPFSIRGVDGRYFIDWIDPLRLPASLHGIRIGDELIEFDKKPISEVIKKLSDVTGKCAHEPTDLALTDMKLTIRLGSDGDIVPKGPVEIALISAKTNKMNRYQLHWSYNPEKIKNPFDFIQPFNFLCSLFNPNYKEKPKLELSKILMANPTHQALTEKYTDRSGGFGSRNSFLPDLGKVIWSNDQPEEGKETLCFYRAYIYQSADGRKIGYVRIPHYYLSSEMEQHEVKEFGRIIRMFEEKTEALVIDQLHNFGGYVHIQYAILSMLINQPLQTPYHRIKITQEDVLDAHQKLAMIKSLNLLVEQEEDLYVYSSREDEPKIGPEPDGFYFEGEKINFLEVLFSKDYYEYIIAEWEQGRTFTNPTPISGVDKINPHPKYQYTKPILMLIDEMDFSGGDFVPAMLQDNQRALLFGARTAGAGGYVSKFKFPNHHGIGQCSYTASIAERMDSNKIENLGTQPNVPYKITVQDVQSGYSGYIEAVNQAVDYLLQNSVIE